MRNDEPETLPDQNPQHPGQYERHTHIEHIEKVEVSELVNVPHDDKPKPSFPAMNMPMPAAQSAAEIKAVGVEGEPGDPKAGPGMLWAELAAMVALAVVLASALAIWLGWMAGIATLAFAGLALILNPVVGAALQRARDRNVVVHLHDGETKSGR